MTGHIDRRRFLGAGVAGAVLRGAALGRDEKGPQLKKAVKYGMIGIKGSIQDKFELIKKIGFLGVEIDSPSGLDLDEANAAQKATGIKIHGVIDSVHWAEDHRLSSPDEAARARGLKALEGALRDANKVGASTMLLVPGVVDKTVTYEQCWDRSQAEVRKALPLAEKLGVKIAIEVVWNNFITKPEQFVEYIDSFKSRSLGGYFDCSNMVKYGVKSGDWIRKLGKRMLKFDFKGYSKAKGWVEIGEGDEDWPDILKALEEVGYNGWATAEVGSGDEKHLRHVMDRMKLILGG
jgi:hexulose-6-phosphate isomerase